jgi:hypothetical protein
MASLIARSTLIYDDDDDSNGSKVNVDSSKNFVKQFHPIVEIK